MFTELTKYKNKGGQEPMCTFVDMYCAEHGENSKEVAEQIYKMVTAVNNELEPMA